MYMTKKEKKAILEAMQQIRNNLREESTLFNLGSTYTPYAAAKKLQSRYFRPGGYDLNYNPFNPQADGSLDVTATRTSRNRKTDMYKDPAGNVHVGGGVDSPGFTLTPGLRYISGTGQSTKEFEKGMEQARRRNVDQAGASRMMNRMRNIKDKLRYKNADMIGD